MHIPTHTLQGIPSHQRVQLMMSRILQSQWAIPAGVHISPECRDLLTRLLVADPHQRLNVQQVRVCMVECMSSKFHITLVNRVL